MEAHVGNYRDDFIRAAAHSEDDPSKEEAVFEVPFADGSKSARQDQYHRKHKKGKHRKAFSMSDRWDLVMKDNIPSQDSPRKEDLSLDQRRKIELVLLAPLCVP